MTTVALCCDQPCGGPRTATKLIAGDGTVLRELMRITLNPGDSLTLTYEGPALAQLEGWVGRLR